jgi:cytochrome c551/c552
MIRSLKRTQGRRNALRFSVLGSVIGVLMMSGLPSPLIGVIIARSPYTHANLRPEGYDRTEIAYVGEEHQFEGIPLANPRLAETGDLAGDGQMLFFRYGCMACHGQQGRGGAVGKDISDEVASKISKKVRSGPKAMPTPASELSDADLRSSSNSCDRQQYSRRRST